MMMFGRLLLAAALSFAALPAVCPDQAQGRGDLLDPGRPGGRGGRRRDRPRRPGRRRHRRPHLPAQADRRAHAGRGAGAGEQRAGLRGLDRPARRGGAASRAVASWRRRRADPGGASPATASHGPIRIAGRTSAAPAATSPTSPTGLAAADPANAAHYRDARRGVRPAAGRRSTLDPAREIANGAGGQRKAITGHDLVPLFRPRLWRAASSAPRGYNTDSEPTARGRRRPDPPGARAEDQGAVRREHDQPRPGRPRSPAIRAPSSARASTATRCRGPAARRRPTRR